MLHLHCVPLRLYLKPPEMASEAVCLLLFVDAFPLENHIEDIVGSLGTHIGSREFRFFHKGKRIQ